MRSRGRMATGLAVLAACFSAAARAQPARDAALIERGRYVVMLGGCNDCHTPGYAERAGKVAISDWLVGVPLGWHGPWGTTYAPNLRLLFSRMSEAQWIAHARNLQTRPPMPWFTLRGMSDADLRAMYAFVRDLGPAGSEAPKALPPGVRPPAPFVTFPGGAAAPK